MATAIFDPGLWRSANCRNRRHKRCCALSAIAMTGGGWPGASLGERAPDAGAVLVVPGGLDQEATDEARYPCA